MSLSNNSKWMSYIYESKFLSELTIPGTHDTGTWKLKGLYQCQSMTLDQQLIAGIRFLDIRLKPSGENDELEVWHGGKLGNAHLKFDEGIIIPCQAFLRENPTETLIMSIKDESQTRVRKDVFYNKLWKEINDTYNGLFFTEDRIPQLKEVKGKIVFFRRCWAPLLPFPVGINAFNHWPRNSTERWINSAKISFVVQDEYKGFLSVNLKKKFDEYVKPLLDEAKNNSEEKLFVNFCSGTFDGYPKTLAKTTNAKLSEYLSDIYQKRYGIIPMDFPEIQPHLIDYLISSNFEDPHLFTRLRNKVDGAVYLNFMGQMHHIPNPSIANNFFGEGFDWEKIINFRFSASNVGEPLTNGYILTFEGAEKLYVCYQEFGENKPTIRHIPNISTASAFGLLGQARSIPQSKKDEYKLKSLLTFAPHLDEVPKAGNIIKIYSMLGFNKCLDVQKNSNLNGTEVIIQDSNSGKNQLWKLKEAGEGYFYIEPQNAPGKVLDVKNNGSANGTSIIIFGLKNGDNQKWKIEKSRTDEGLFFLVPKNAVDSCLDVEGQKDDNGTKVILHSKKPAGENNNQVWYINLQ